MSYIQYQDIMKYLPILTLSLFWLLTCSSKSVDLVELNNLSLPPGFSISIYADGIENARAMTLGDKGTLFVGSRRAGNVYALLDTNNDNKIDKTYLIASGLSMPTGIDFKDGSLYIAAHNKIIRFDDIEDKLEDPSEPVLIIDNLPNDRSHGWKYLRFGPDGKLYFNVGAPCNICDREEEIYATIVRMNPDGSNLEIVARGVRNSVGFDFHPTTNELWFTDNGRDWLGDDTPPCELNRVIKTGQHFGYPYIHGNDIIDPEFGSRASGLNYQKPVQELGPHVAPLGMLIYNGDMFPEEYKHQIFIAEHGSWNRSKKIGYRVSLVNLDKNFNAVSYKIFVYGWLNEITDSVSGRPADIIQLSDGSILISDDHASKIYRITYNPK